MKEDGWLKAGTPYNGLALVATPYPIISPSYLLLMTAIS